MKKLLVIFGCLLTVSSFGQTALSDTEQIKRFTNSVTILELNSLTFTLTNGKGGTITQTNVPDTLNNPRYTNWLWLDINYDPPVLKQWIGQNHSATITNAYWQPPAIGSNGLSSAQIAAGAITSSKIAPNAIDAYWKISNNVIVSGNLADGAVTISKLAAGAVVGSSIVDGSVTTTKILDNNVTVGKIEQPYSAYIQWLYGQSNNISLATTNTATVTQAIMSVTSPSLASLSNRITTLQTNYAKFTYCRQDDYGATNFGDAQKLYPDSFQLAWFNRTRQGQPWAAMTNLYRNTYFYTNHMAGLSNYAWYGPLATGVLTNIWGTNAYDSVLLQPGNYKITATYPMGLEAGWHHGGILLVNPSSPTSDRLRMFGSTTSYGYRTAARTGTTHTFTGYLTLATTKAIQFEIYAECYSGANITWLGASLLERNGFDVIAPTLSAILASSPGPVGGAGGADFFEWQSIEIQKLDN